MVQSLIDCYLHDICWLMRVCTFMHGGNALSWMGVCTFMLGSMHFHACIWISNHINQNMTNF